MQILEASLSAGAERLQAAIREMNAATQKRRECERLLNEAISKERAAREAVSSARGDVLALACGDLAEESFI